MKLLLLALLTSCAFPESHQFRIQDYSTKYQACVERFLKLGVDPDHSVRICTQAVKEEHIQ